MMNVEKVKGFNTFGSPAHIKFPFYHFNNFWASGNWGNSKVWGLSLRAAIIMFRLCGIHLFGKTYSNNSEE